MGSRELVAYFLIVALLAAAALLGWRVRHGLRKAQREDRKPVRIDLMRRTEPQSEAPVEDSR